MRVHFVVVAAVATFLASSTAADSNPSNLAKNNAADTPLSTRNGQRVLRSYEGKDEVDEDRALDDIVKVLKQTRTGTRWRKYLDAKKIERINNNKAKKLADQAKKLEQAAKKDEKLFNRINALYKKKVSYEDLYMKEKIDNFDVFRALKVSEKAKNSEEGLWWAGYFDYWVKMKELGVKGG
ncbi:putative secreted RxLR effector protein [Phytophthora cinnamomi]|uniref:putative secreted RxLR effector protein n=1 Tax=Phytophthora cinnamomi TaxID=4785 RepID=UPI003559FD5F|nr:putative secreted RxLR effector protein [Phytophthora cinnamomi]